MSLREWYAREAVQQGWPRDTLELQIRKRLHLRKGAAITNFERRLEPAQSGLAKEILKDPYLPSIEELEASLPAELKDEE